MDDNKDIIEGIDAILDDMDGIEFQLGKEAVNTLKNQLNLFQELLSNMDDVSDFREKHENCENCQFYRNSECRRFPPTVWGDSTSEYSCSYACNFPCVSKNDWCGEYRPTKESTEVLLKKLRGEHGN